MLVVAGFGTGPYNKRMSWNDDDLDAAIIALGAIGLGIAGFAALSRWEKKKSFHAALKAGLAEHEVSLVAAEVGRGANGGPTWFVTVNHPWAGLQSYQADFNRGTELYTATTLNELIGRLVQAMPATSPVWGTG
jgi:hypothetical protein